ncbi:zinc finger and SCAN domain-containing protein 21-like [Eublepharis macularius]|uniref:Zinc finger and SCAN domain-containing protein 21-like n=1 Tax=Eublepharis macularius TaxID=481883 RepID=A0AA97J551_EUBMA|nr:zinc finger and SCAN domain-containing protein 21-like [Eublepharis macularius]
MATGLGNASSLTVPEQKMKVEEPDLSERGPGKGPSVIQAGKLQEIWERNKSEGVKEEPQKGSQQPWEAQLQEFLKVMESSDSDGRNPQLLGLTLREEAQMILPLSAGVTDARTPLRRERATCLPSHLRRKALQLDNEVLAEAQANHGKVKEEILEEKEVEGAWSSDTKRQRFRQFGYQEAEGPQEVCKQLRELCYQWLKPEKRTKEQILELVILEQFLTILPQEMHSWVMESGPETSSEAVTLAEEFLLRQCEDKRQGEQRLGPCQEIGRNLPEAESVLSATWKRPCSKGIKQESERDGPLLGGLHKEVQVLG